MGLPLKHAWAALALAACAAPAQQVAAIEAPTLALARVDRVTWCRADAHPRCVEIPLSPVDAAAAAAWWRAPYEAAAGTEYPYLYVEGRDADVGVPEVPPRAAPIHGVRLPTIDSLPHLGAATEHGVLLLHGLDHDPAILAVSAGGAMDLSAHSPECLGFATRVATLRVVGDADALAIAALASEGIDLVLATRDSSGAWRCADDRGDGLAPLLVLGAVTGETEVWVGTYDRTVPVSARVAIATRSTLSIGELQR